MINSTLALGGWAAAVVALLSAALARRALARRLQAIAEACHELRAALAAVMLGVELGGREGAFPPARRRAIELELGRAALVLGDLERAPGGIAGADDTDVVNVRELLADSVEAWRPSASARGAGLRLRWSGPDGWVRGDRLRLAQATGNLIANAIEHGGGNVEVRGGSSGDRVRIELLDGGPGLSAPVGELVSSSPATRGTWRGLRRRAAPRRGHGLKITQAIAAAHGGRLAAAPAERGARLVLELPADARAACARAEHR